MASPPFSPQSLRDVRPETPSSLLKVRGKYHSLGCELDPSHLTIGDPIGEDGSRSQVFAAQYYEPETGIVHDVAVKKFPPARTPHEIKTVHREIGLVYLASTRCHHCARCWGYTQGGDGALTLVMNRYAQSLNTKLRSMPEGLPLDEVQRLGRQIAKAGHELHAQNVVLSDLKPANILLDDFDDIAVADFGISTLLKRGEEQDDGLHGTFNYMSPEAFDNESFGRVTTMSDIWSFACCLVEMASGRRPWSGTQMSAICFKVTVAREIPDIPLHLPADVRQLLQACFAYDSSARPTFREIYKVFSQPWGEAQKTLGDTHDNPELLRLRHEEARWSVQRKELVAKVRRDACLVAEMQQNVVEHQEVNEKLQEQLILLVNSLKQQQSQSHISAGTAGSDAERYVAHLELQLAGCQDALKQCMRQKDVAKEMLRQESSRTRHLSEQVVHLNKLQDSTQDMALHLAVQVKLAETEVKNLSADIAAEDSTLLPRPTERPNRVRHRKTAYPFHHPQFGTRTMFGCDSLEVESARESRDSSSTELSNASTPSPMMNSWEQTPTTHRSSEQQRAFGNA